MVQRRVTLRAYEPEAQARVTPTLACASGWYDRQDEAEKCYPDRCAIEPCHDCHSQAERNPPARWGTNRSWDLPRVDDESPAGLEVSRITSHDMKPMTKGGRRKKPVDARDGDPGLLGSCRELAPDAGRLHIDREDPVAELALQPREPRCEGLLLPARGEEGDALWRSRRRSGR